MGGLAVEVELELLRGFRYACRPDCGLCCYAEPRVEPAEESRLLKIAPEVDVVTLKGGNFLEARPDGGACQFLRGTRCGVWEARPSPCREFPVTVHVGERLQATLVLSCPGIDLATLTEDTSWASRPDPSGFDAELASVRARLDPAPRVRLDAARRRRRRLVIELERDGRWIDEEEVRRELRAHLPLPSDEAFPPTPPPAANDGLELLPLFFDGRPGPLAFAEGLGGWEVHELRPEGGRDPPVAVIPPPHRAPEMGPGGRRMLEGYLRYFLERDALFGTVLSDLDPEGTRSVTEEVAEELRAIGALVLGRADVRRRFRGTGEGPLTAVQVADGIRASDQELLDRPTWGDRL